ncbi:hypothetical protein SPRG_18653 [Saprolegnia parasitica CBS 223.65]|uniref:PDZ domain-containing protein n=1 Tax=Saprolegnia parasitica (strain CBS 223.65) TaxID=695850 RepID=A0A067BM58_SAPPC|nr:hypothetical protein SPRG_18653 [Saprolegnia parasitica CBS 223.65]KDO15812.1 hypothetical protein SPRG_18653 [Saprolegnia parasitica CBS 223.65]|eukprot:XP_012213481.1 hypothetical protein SPRG_18653 [Saprolegnia parasitica CBS 223.65]
MLPSALPSRLFKSINSWKGRRSEYESVHTLDELPVAEAPTQVLTCHLAPRPAPSPRTEASSPMSYDVLLHKDEHGLGLCLAVDDAHRLVVASFRRLHANDVGPAEACNQIHQGDFLCEINGDEVFTLPHVHRLLVALRSEAFVLLRFRRGSPMTPLLVGANSAAETTSPRAVPTQRERQLSHLVHDLALKNQLLHSQLAEIHGQLLQKNRELESTEQQLQEAKVEATRSSRLWPAKGSGQNAKLELDTLLTECKSQLKRECEEQMQLERAQLRATHRRELERHEAASTKKLRMLEEALGFLIDQVDARPLDEMPPVSDEAVKLQDIRGILASYAARRRQIDRLVQETAPSVTSA